MAPVAEEGSVVAWTDAARPSNERPGDGDRLQRMRALVTELGREFEVTERELDALVAAEGDVDVALGRIAERRGQLVTQLTLMSVMLRRELRRSGRRMSEGDDWLSRIDS